MSVFRTSVYTLESRKRYMVARWISNFPIPRLKTPAFSFAVDANWYCRCESTGRSYHFWHLHLQWPGRLLYLGGCLLGASNRSLQQGWRIRWSRDILWYLITTMGCHGLHISRRLMANQQKYCIWLFWVCSWRRSALGYPPAQNVNDTHRDIRIQNTNSIS